MRSGPSWKNVRASSGKRTPSAMISWQKRTAFRSHHNLHVALRDMSQSMEDVGVDDLGVAECGEDASVAPRRSGFMKRATLYLGTSS
jgi:hypothetical protein